MFGGNTKMCVASRKRSCLQKMIRLKEWGGAGCSSNVKILIPFHSLFKTPSDQRNVWRVLRTCLERLDGYRGKEPPCQGSGPDQLQWRPPLGRASAGTIGHFELKPLLQEKRNVNAFSQLKDIKNIKGPTWKYIVSVSRARWRRNPAPVEVRFLSSTWFHNFYGSCFSLWATFKEADSHSAKTTFVLLNHSLNAVHLRSSRPPLYATC